MIRHEDSTTGLQVYLPQRSGSGYVFGGPAVHTKYVHAKYLYGQWQGYQYHVSITFSCYHSCKLSQTQLQEIQNRGIEVDIDWRFVGKSRLWQRQYLPGLVNKASCHPAIRQHNQAAILQENYPLVWGPWDEFKNCSILQLLHLHSAPKGAIAGKSYAYSLLVISQTEPFPNQLFLEDNLLKLKFYASGTGKNLLQAASTNDTLLRVFVTSKFIPKRRLSSKSTILHLPLMKVVAEGKDKVHGSFFILLVTLSEADLLLYK